MTKNTLHAQKERGNGTWRDQPDRSRCMTQGVKEEETLKKEKKERKELTFFGGGSKTSRVHHA